MQIEDLTHTRNPTQVAFWVLFVLVAIWLSSSLWFVNLELDDGYTTIVNAQYFLGISDQFYWQRGPLISALLIPAELFANAAELHPLNVRPHHLTMVLMHLLYIWGVWTIAVQHLGARSTVLVAFFAAVPSVAFLSYAPFISHDIFPGLIFIYMLSLADGLRRQFSLSPWLQIISLGALAVLIKHTFAILWVAILASVILENFLTRKNHANTLRPTLLLIFGAALSALAAIGAYGLLLSDIYPDRSWWLRPLLQADAVVSYFRNLGPMESLFYQDVYAKNLGAYGILAVILIIPGLIFSITKGSSFQRLTAFSLMLSLILMHLIQFREVRYLLFVAPLVFVTILPAIEYFSARGVLYVLAGASLMIIHACQIFYESTRIYNHYYAHEVTDFFRDLPEPQLSANNLIVADTLNFISPEKYAFHGDKYHRITHLIGRQIGALYRYPSDRLLVLESAHQIRSTQFKAGDVLIFSNDIAARQPPLNADNSTSLQPYFSQFLGVADFISVVRSGDRFEMNPYELNSPVVFLPMDSSKNDPVTTVRWLSQSDIAKLVEKNSADPLVLKGFRVSSYCSMAGCQNY